MRDDSHHILIVMAVALVAVVLICALLMRPHVHLHGPLIAPRPVQPVPIPVPVPVRPWDRPWDRPHW